jgi:hypothetical protein
VPVLRVVDAVAHGLGSVAEEVHQPVDIVGNERRLVAGECRGYLGDDVGIVDVQR